MNRILFNLKAKPNLKSGKILKDTDYTDFTDLNYSKKSKFQKNKLYLCLAYDVEF